MDKILTLCKKYKVKQLFAFGSVLTPRFNSESDVDFIVKFNKAQITDYFSNFFDLKYALEDILGREVDLLEEQAIRNSYLKENIDRTKALIYGWFHSIVDARNYIIHGYDSLSVDILWSIIINHLPILEEEVKHLLREDWNSLS